MASALLDRLRTAAQPALRLFALARSRGPGAVAEVCRKAVEIQRRCAQSDAWARTRRLFAAASETMDKSLTAKDTSPRDFLPGLLRLQEAPPSPLAKTIMRSMLALFGLLLV